MGRTPKRLTGPQRDRIYDLCRSGKTSAVVSTLCLEGDEDLKGFRVSASYVRTVYMRERERRGELYRPQTTGLPNPRAIQNLVGRMIETAEREVERCERAQINRKFNPDHFAKLAIAIGRLDKLASQIPAEDDKPTPGKPAPSPTVPEPSTFTQRLINGEPEPGDAPLSDDAPATAPLADVIVGANGNAPGPKPTVNRASVPSDLHTTRDDGVGADGGLVPPASALVGGSA